MFTSLVSPEVIIRVHLVLIALFKDETTSQGENLTKSVQHWKENSWDCNSFVMLIQICVCFYMKKTYFFWLTVSQTNESFSWAATHCPPLDSWRCVSLCVCARMCFLFKLTSFFRPGWWHHPAVVEGWKVHTKSLLKDKQRTLFILESGPKFWDWRRKWVTQADHKTSQYETIGIFLGSLNCDSRSFSHNDVPVITSVPLVKCFYDICSFSN